MSIFDIFKSKARKATEQADQLAIFHFSKGLYPTVLGTAFHQRMIKEARQKFNVEMSPKHFIGMNIGESCKEANIETRAGKYTVVVSIPGVRDQLHLKPSEDFAAACMMAGEFLAISPRPVYGIKTTQHPMPGRINIVCYNMMDEVYTIMLCSEYEG